MKTEEIIPIILIIVVVIGLGYFVYQYSNSTENLPSEQNEFSQEEVGGDEITKLIRKIQSETEIGFSGMNTVNFGWMISGDQAIPAEGKEIRVNRASIDSEGEIVAFFEDNGFVRSKNNNFQEGIFRVEGFRNGSVGCLVRSEENSEDSEKVNIEIKCGELIEFLSDNACTDSGGTISSSMCCTITEDFPNTCAIGACGCSSENSHEVMTCDCGENKCFDGDKCIEINF